MAASLVLVLFSLTLTYTSALDKQIKLEDIERDNLQTELSRRPQPSPQHEQVNQLRQQQLHLQQQQQLHRQHQAAYQHQLLQQRYSAAQEPLQRYSTPQETQQRYSTPQESHQQPLTYHQQFQQQIQQHREQALLREREREREREQPHLRERERTEAQQMLQHYAAPTQQLLHEVTAGGPHVMYLIMPGGNIAAIPIAHPNQIQALFTPVKPHYNSLYQSSPIGVSTQVVPAYFQPQAVPMPAHASAQHEPEQPTRTQLHYVLPSQQHRITFSQYSQPQHSHIQPQQAVVYRESDQAETELQYTPQSQKSIFSSGVKSTVAPQLKGSATGFSTQTGSSYANFRQYSG